MKQGVLMGFALIMACVPTALRSQSGGALTNADVLKMVQAKVGDDVIVAEIHKSLCNFSTGPEDLIALKKEGVSDVVLEAMTSAEAAPVPQTPLSLQKIRKIYVVDPHQFGYVAPGHIKKGIGKSDCLQLADDPLRADAILAPIVYKSWLDKIGDGLGGTCVSNADSVVCQSGDGGVDFLKCDAGGCTSGTIPVENTSLKWVFIDPKSGKVLPDWSMNLFPSAKKVEEAVGCR